MFLWLPQIVRELQRNTDVWYNTAIPTNEVAVNDGLAIIESMAYTEIGLKLPYSGGDFGEVSFRRSFHQCKPLVRHLAQAGCFALTLDALCIKATEDRWESLRGLEDL